VIFSFPSLGMIQHWLLCTIVDFMLKNTASGNRRGAFLLVLYLAIWSSTSTHANQIAYSTLSFMENFLWYL